MKWFSERAAYLRCFSRHQSFAMGVFKGVYRLLASLFVGYRKGRRSGGAKKCLIEGAR